LLQIFNTYFVDVPQAAGCLTIQPDNKFILSRMNDLEYYDDANYITRYLPKGTADSSFGINGNIAFPQTGYSSLEVDRILLQQDNKIVMLDFTDDYLTGPGYFYLFRYKNDVASFAGNNTKTYKNDESLSRSNDNKTAIYLSPNPATDKITINGLSNGTYEITVMTGDARIAGKTTTNSNNYAINIQHLPAGIYYLIVTQNNSIVARQRFVKQ
jgi:hypothetical protein